MTESTSNNNNYDGEASPFDTSRYKSNEHAEDFGYNFYPDRASARRKTFWEKMWTEGRGKKFKCEANVTWCVENHPMVKLLLRALKRHGCPVNLRRHIACEPCVGYVNGGYDPQQNQVVVCQNTAKKRWLCCNVLAHEFIHAFDYCRAKVDFMNIHHLACTEIRAANFMHCSFMAAMSAGSASPFNIKQKHADCVKQQAVKSIVIVRNISNEAALEIVNEVFDKCYNDLEPVGRIPRKASRDNYRALLEGQLYGYSE
ncbi:mitochondrial inner membrane protease ATP23 homolog [Octopus sinensis]|uniref:Mitochondrial inner membrane protease ATP23 n=1 Tax=Octopus sinensis TaxID=2607531 RepID=A0A6P7T9Q9_9MOLL|nr:mitochondrial inner membrane protease ATP23 homolog [Octopus sinensis]XP_036366901.1 mitochondrial inner membrane protease ATP23 homolog [Octopus sinensis]XP_036366902.1 mitochondrial inner membrane protease ATP23 homolog [Octopus sinensis]